MQIAHVVSKLQNFLFFPMVHLLVFGVSLLLCTYRKLDKTIHRSCPCIQPLFSGYTTELTGKPSAPFERVKNLDLKTFLRYYTWRTWEYIRTGVPHIQTNRNIHIICMPVMLIHYVCIVGRRKEEVRGTGSNLFSIIIYFPIPIQLKYRVWNACLVSFLNISSTCVPVPESGSLMAQVISGSG
jgi:hypothetical protein